MNVTPPLLTLLPKYESKQMDFYMDGSLNRPGLGAGKKLLDLKGADVRNG